MNGNKSVLIKCITLFLTVAVFQLAGMAAPRDSATKPATNSARTGTAKTSGIRLPDWQNINNYRFPKLLFSKTTQKEFSKIYPDINLYEDPDQSIRIYTYKTPADRRYNSVKFGFEDEKLSWIDYLPKVDININQIIDVFGTPLAVNSKASKYLDYYDYGTFLVSADKETREVYTFTQNGAENIASNDAKKIGLKLPGLKELETGKIDKLVPGLTTQKAFLSYYPSTKETRLASQFYPDVSQFDSSDDYLPVIYYVNQGLQDTNYKNIEIVFKKDILSWVNFVPQKLSVQDALNLYGKDYKLDKTNPNVTFYYYKNLILTASTKTNMVLNIGVLGSVNTQLRNLLPAWENLNKEGIKGLKVDSTTEADFKKLLGGLLAQKQTEGNIDIYKVIEGLSFTDYETIYFVFKNKKLTSVDLVPSKPIRTGDIIKAYGKNYDFDKTSNDELNYYTFDNVIVSTYKDSKIVNSIGLF
jgi:hypothetical protein